MLPFNAQGGNQALEDCGALFALFSNLPKKSLLRERLKLFDQVRRKRANRQQIVSSVPAEETKYLGDKLKEYESEGPPNVARSEDMRESILRELGYIDTSETQELFTNTRRYDVFERCNEVMRGANYYSRGL
jgi:salicylate hydroxylase